MRKHISTIILILVFFVGLSVLLYPSVSDYVNSLHATKAIIDYEAALKNMAPKDYSQEFLKAERYNEAIRKVLFPFIHYNRVKGYGDVLNVSGTGMMGYIKIEKIAVELPIYHGISPGVLNRAAGHIPGSSLPVGGLGVHAVLSAHRGLPSAKLFSNLDKLTEGDVFTLTILNRVLAYEVDQILIVKPDQVDELCIQDGKDYCTLVTCTPYGINTHRMLVRGHRIDVPGGAAVLLVPADAIQIAPMVVAPVVAVPMLLALLILMLVKKGKENNALTGLKGGRHDAKSPNIHIPDAAGTDAGLLRERRRPLRFRGGL